MAAYDPESGDLTWGEDMPAGVTSADDAAPRTYGADSWRWLFLQPLQAPAADFRGGVVA